MTGTITTMNNSTSIRCPLCQRCVLTHDTVAEEINCNNCKFKINTKTSKMTLSKLEEQLDSIVKEHNCDEIPNFHYTSNNNDISDTTTPNDDPTLIMSCTKCNCMKFILL